MDQTIVKQTGSRLTLILCKDGQGLHDAWLSAIDRGDMVESYKAMREYFMHRNGYSDRYQRPVITGCLVCEIIKIDLGEPDSV